MRYNPAKRATVEAWEAYFKARKRTNWRQFCVFRISQMDSNWSKRWSYLNSASGCPDFLRFSRIPRAAGLLSVIFHQHDVCALLARQGVENKALVRAEG
jgi:hypothetical protein